MIISKKMKINEKYSVKDNSIIKDVLNNLKNSAIGISIVVNKKKICCWCNY